MKITIAFKHPWSILDRVAHIERTDTTGRMAQRVIKAIDTRLAKIVIPCTTDSVTLWQRYVAKNDSDTFPEWPTETNDTPEQRDKWNRLRNARRRYNEERAELETLRKHYERETYTVKELDDLTPEELRAIDDFEADILPSYLQERRKGEAIKHTHK